jgi:hypothetical protein
MSRANGAEQPKRGHNYPSTRKPVNESRRCTAHSSRTGQPCKRAAVIGGAVCSKHGGSAPQVKARAAERILMSADLGARRLIQFMNDRKVPYAVRLRAAESLLDRAGLGATQMVKAEVTSKWEDFLEETVTFTMTDGDATGDESEAVRALQEEIKELQREINQLENGEQDDAVAESTLSRRAGRAAVGASPRRTSLPAGGPVIDQDGRPVPTARGDDTPPKRIREQLAEEPDSPWE